MNGLVGIEDEHWTPPRSAIAPSLRTSAESDASSSLGPSAGAGTAGGLEPHAQRFEDVLPFGAALLDPREYRLDNVHGLEKQRCQVRRQPLFALAQLTQQVLGAASNRLQHRNTRKAAGSLDGVDGAKDTREQLLVVETLLKSTNSLSNCAKFSLLSIRNSLMISSNSSISTPRSRLVIEIDQSAVTLERWVSPVPKAHRPAAGRRAAKSLETRPYPRRIPLRPGPRQAGPLAPEVIRIRARRVRFSAAGRRGCCDKLRVLRSNLSAVGGFPQADGICLKFTRWRSSDG